jgi:hypothetical protein
VAYWMKRGQIGSKAVWFTKKRVERENIVRSILRELKRKRERTVLEEHRDDTKLNQLMAIIN